MKNTSLKGGMLAIGLFIASSGATCMAEKPAHQAFSEFAQELTAAGHHDAARLPKFLAEGLSKGKTERMGFFALNGIALVGPARQHADFIVSKANVSSKLEASHKSLLAGLVSCIQTMNAAQAAQLVQNA